MVLILEANYIICITLGRSQKISILETNLHQSENLCSFSPGDSFSRGFIFLCPISSFVVFQWCLCLRIPQSSFGISFPTLLPPLSEVLERQERFFSCSGSWVVTLWLVCGWGEVEQQPPCSAGSLPVCWAGEPSAGWDTSRRARKDGGLSLEVCLLPEPFATFAILFFIVKSYCKFGTLKNFILGLCIVIPNLNSWQLLKFCSPLSWALCGVLMCYRMNEDRVLISGGGTESQNTATAAAFLGLWWSGRFGNPLSLFDSVCLITASQNQYLSY